MQSAREEIAFHFGPFIAYFLVWLVVCSKGLESQLIAQGILLSIAYLISQFIGVYKCHHLFLSADGPHTLIMLPFLLASAVINHFLIGMSWGGAFKSLMPALFAFFLGHIAALAAGASLSFVLRVR